MQIVQSLVLGMINAQTFCEVTIKDPLSLVHSKHNFLILYRVNVLGNFH